MIGAAEAVVQAAAAALDVHLASGITTVARCWAVVRRDGVVMGFTDHDRDLHFEGVVFQAGSGMSARAISQTTGLSVDNSEAVGALSDAGISEADLMAGRFDGAQVRAWLVNWSDAAARRLIFRGHMGEIVRAGGAFQAELRGLTETLGLPQGRVYQQPCSAVLGDAQCRVDTDQPGYSVVLPVATVIDGREFDWPVLDWPVLSGFDDRWFEAGRIVVLDGSAAGLVGLVKADRLSAAGRRVELWDALRAPVRPGDAVRLEAGCDKRAQTCRLKFDNFLNFRGFPHVPGDDWLTAYPVAGGRNDGGRLRG